MTSAQIRQSFLDFFRSKQHTIVPSSSLMPDSPNLLFTNAGMNQFVPALVKSRFGESGMSEDDGTMVCCFDRKKSRNDWRICVLVMALACNQ